MCFALGVTACGGSAPEPETASTESAKEPDTSASVGSKASTDEPAEPSSEKKDDGAKPSAAPSDSSPTRSAADVLLKPDVLFVFSFTASEPHQVAEKKCKESAKDDPKKMSECMSAASKKVDVDSLSFQKDGDGKLWWMTVKRGKGGALVTLHKIEFEVGKDSDSKVTLKPHGPDKGSKPMGGIPKELNVEVEGESSIAIADPKLGRLVYEAKLGLIGKSGP